MPSCRKKSVTLIELIIAITLVSVIILGINSISIFSHYHLISSDRRVKVQNAVSYCLDHITKEGSKAIGNEAVFGSTTVVNATGGSLTVFIDANQDGVRNTSTDHWIKYKVRLNPGIDYNKLLYCSECNNVNCGSCQAAAGWETLANNITAFTPLVNFTKGNYIDVKITGCYDPDGTPNACNTLDNPQVTMQASVNLPSVSTH